MFSISIYKRTESSFIFTQVYSLISSANSKNIAYFINRPLSFINIENSGGSKVDLWGASEFGKYDFEANFP